MAKNTQTKHKQVVKSTCQASGANIKTSTMNKSFKRNFKRYRGQGR